MSDRSILLVGAGGHAKACIDVIEQEGRYTVAGLVALPQEIGNRVLSYEVIGSDGSLGTLREQYLYAFVCVGQIKTPEPRIRIFESLDQSGWTLPTIVSPRAYVSPHAKLGVGSIVMHGAVVNAGAIVGSNCIINTHAVLEHDVLVGDHCHIGPSATLNGGVQVGAGTFIGSGCTVRELVRIAGHCLIGMGHGVLRDCEAGTRIPPVRKPS